MIRILSAIYAEALYGRGLSRRAMGQVEAGDADLSKAHKLESRVADLFEITAANERGRESAAEKPARDHGPTIAWISAI